jgi:LPPG:FO 2-phospho-L-lactate transferase
MSNTAVETRLRTSGGELNFQQYFVRERWQCSVLDVHFCGASEAKPTPGVLDAIQHSEAVVLAPSNPITSIGPILGVAGIRGALRVTPAPVLAVSPIVAGDAVSGPAARLMLTRGLHPSASGVAEAYRDFLNALILDEQDAHEAETIEQLRIRAVTARTLMKTDADRIALARVVLGAAREGAVKSAGLGGS